MDFHKYASISNFDSKKELEYIRELVKCGKIEDKFVVQEKIHGANFSIWYDGKEIKYAKRTAFLDKYDDFFEYEWMKQNREKEIKELVEKIWKEQKAEKTVILFGELFGGYYPDTEKIKGLKNIQAGLWYTNILDFIGFDIFIDDKFLEINTSKSYFEKSGLKSLTNLFEGSLEDSLLYSVEFETKIPKLYNLPEIENNSTEGIVISHISEHIKLKKKNLKFKERSKKNKPKKTPDKISPEGEQVWEKISEFLGEDVLQNRLDNVISKETKIILGNKGKAMGLLSKDIVEEISKEFEDYNILDKKDKKIINGAINKACGLFVRDLG
ncbi:MAG: RNA ligase family protein [Candidatus Gracilibacteria bacterium]|nr:RNA ligase family protein [Candidatus Gracilibacteria bacterium]MDQ7022537.1 RNA ligase family protein [Candidatus Gracilibacteria bacterium]